MHAEIVPNNFKFVNAIENFHDEISLYGDETYDDYYCLLAHVQNRNCAIYLKLVQFKRTWHAV